MEYITFIFISFLLVVGLMYAVSSGGGNPTPTQIKNRIVFKGHQEIIMASDGIKLNPLPTIINDEDYGIRVAIEQWMDLIAEHKLNKRNEVFTSKEGEAASYKQSLKVTQFSKSGKDIHHYHFLGAFPTALSTIALDWGSSEIEEYTCTWTYDRWMPGREGVHSLQSEQHAN